MFYVFSKIQPIYCVFDDFTVNYHVVNVIFIKKDSHQSLHNLPARLKWWYISIAMNRISIGSYQTNPDSLPQLEKLSNNTE